MKANRVVKTNLEETLSQATWAKHLRVKSAYKKNRNLKDILVRAKLHPPGERKEPPFNEVAKNQKTGTTTNLPKHIPLAQTNCVYIIQCKWCPQLYVGETQNSLGARLANHKYNITNGHKTQTYLVQHFQKHGFQNLYLKGLEHNPEWNTTERRRVEGHWIRKLGSDYPFGLNEKSPL